MIHYWDQRGLKETVGRDERTFMCMSVREHHYVIYVGSVPLTDGDGDNGLQADFV